MLPQALFSNGPRLKNTQICHKLYILKIYQNTKSRKLCNFTFPSSPYRNNVNQFLPFYEHVLPSIMLFTETSLFIPMGHSKNPNVLKHKKDRTVVSVSFFFSSLPYPSSSSLKVNGLTGHLTEIRDACVSASTGLRTAPECTHKGDLQRQELSLKEVLSCPA